MYVSRFNYLVRISAAHFSLDSRAIAWLRIAHACINSRVSRGALHIVAKSREEFNERYTLVAMDGLPRCCSLSREIILHYGRVPREDALARSRKVDPRRRARNLQVSTFPISVKSTEDYFPFPYVKRQSCFSGTRHSVTLLTNFRDIGRRARTARYACQAVKGSIFQTETSFSSFIIVCKFVNILSSCNNSIQFD